MYNLVSFSVCAKLPDTLKFPRHYASATFPFRVDSQNPPNPRFESDLCT